MHTQTAVCKVQQYQTLPIAHSTKKNYILDFYFNMHYFSVLHSNSEVGTSSSPYMSTEQENH